MNTSKWISPNDRGRIGLSLAKVPTYELSSLSAREKYRGPINPTRIKNLKHSVSRFTWLMIMGSLLNLLMVGCIFVILTGSAGACEKHEIKTGGIWAGFNFNHVSQLDAGPPFNEKDEDAVDHLGIHAMLRDQFADDWEYFAGISLGRNFNVTDCTQCWNDGDAEIDSLIFVGVQKRLYSW